MARQARIVVPGNPHHVVHRGNLRAQVFFTDDDRRFYLELLAGCAGRFDVEVWAYCLMSNHVHLIAVPHDKDGLARAIGLCHQRYASAVNARHGWTGNLWANRFFSSVLDEGHLWRAVRYIELNPVRACLADQAGQWQWSSARGHLGEREDSLLAPGRPFPGQWTGDWQAFSQPRADAGGDRLDSAKPRHGPAHCRARFYQKAGTGNRTKVISATSRSKTERWGKYR